MDIEGSINLITVPANSDSELVVRKQLACHDRAAEAVPSGTEIAVEERVRIVLGEGETSPHFGCRKFRGTGSATNTPGSITLLFKPL
jgi:hypothetical protein